MAWLYAEIEADVMLLVDEIPAPANGMVRLGAWLIYGVPSVSVVTLCNVAERVHQAVGIPRKEPEPQAPAM